jgi:hypothetical protein
VLRKQGVSAPVSAVIIYRCSDYTAILFKDFLKKGLKKGFLNNKYIIIKKKIKKKFKLYILKKYIYIRII